MITVAIKFQSGVTAVSLAFGMDYKYHEKPQRPPHCLSETKFVKGRKATEETVSDPSCPLCSQIE
jgi:hypothetical protein